MRFRDGTTQGGGAAIGALPVRAARTALRINSWTPSPAACAWLAISRSADGGKTSVGR